MGSNKITFINHASALIQLNGVNILTDPVYSRTVSFFLVRLKPPGIPIQQLPPLHHILISHNHYDHLNLRTLRRLRRRHEASILFPRGVARYGKRAGFQHVAELSWWETFVTDGLKITCVPAKHFSGRMLWDHNRSLACGYVIESHGITVYYAGDTAYGEFLKEIAARFSIDVALLPIGAYKPYEWFKNIHMHPKQAVQALLDLRAKHLVPIHWGTFKISDEPRAEPPILLRQEAERLGLGHQVHILDNGESFEF
jgi:L-ascorbate metabolism protein UlaG (beta-lactamase superfamily)